MRDEYPRLMRGRLPLDFADSRPKDKEGAAPRGERTQTYVTRSGTQA